MKSVGRRFNSDTLSKWKHADQRYTKNGLMLSAYAKVAPERPQGRRVYVKFARRRLIRDGGKTTRDQCNGLPDTPPVPVTGTQRQS